jgi:hypothetical protein
MAAGAKATRADLRVNEFLEANGQGNCEGIEVAHAYRVQCVKSKANCLWCLIASKWIVAPDSR